MVKCETVCYGEWRQQEIKLINGGLHYYLIYATVSHGELIASYLYLKSCPLRVMILPLQWHHNVYDGIWNHQPQDCLLNRLSRRRSKKKHQSSATCFCVGNSPENSPHKGPVTQKMFPFDDEGVVSQMAEELFPIKWFIYNPDNGRKAYRTHSTMRETFDIYGLWFSSG